MNEQKLAKRRYCTSRSRMQYEMVAGKNEYVEAGGKCYEEIGSVDRASNTKLVEKKIMKISDIDVTR